MEKRRSLQAKKQRLLKGLETLMRMAPDLVAQRPGALDDDWMATDGSDGVALFHRGNGRYSQTCRVSMGHALSSTRDMVRRRMGLPVSGGARG